MPATLYGYLQDCQRILFDLKQEAVNPANLTSFINKARGQVAGEGSCIRVQGSVVTTPGVRNYNFSSITLGVSGVQGVLNIGRILYGVASGYRWIAPRPWAWFDLYGLNNPVPTNAAPEMWAQYAQGASGSFYLDPPPDIAYTLSCDCACYPSDLVDNTSVEAIPYLWTDAVPYYACYLAYLTAQRGDRAKEMFGLFENFMQRARQAANPTVGRWQYSQAMDPAQAAKLGLKPPQSGGG